MNFRLLLDLLERQLDAFERAARPDYELMEDIVRYMREYPDRFHHPWEDLIFARLANADTAIEPIVADLKRQHATLARSGSDLLDSLRGAVAGVLLPRHALEQPGREYVARFRAHMEMEEQKLFPLLGTRLAPDDWNAVDTMMAARKDPLFGRQVAGRYERLYREIAASTARAG
ncbi:AraC family transcriptional regulator [Sulfurifustis variabilis]|uniref:AraC family transcriptional regulator n=1 Tax=Sulfurifustis variabilis TaxID=1675686 RepID=A0A1B4V5T0_9GAMM|nr:AraC family transcriptional regulator [Sulfurifustis variabilis]